MTVTEMGGGVAVKQAVDRFTPDMLGKPRRGRPPKPDALTPAERARRYRQNKRQTAPPAVAVLFARSDSVYKTLPGTDVWDQERDARRWPGGGTVVAHPPCRAWAGLSHLAKPADDEAALAVWAVEQVRRNGGVLEHPKRSQLWPALGLPQPGEFDEFGGWTLPVHQWWWGHKAEKATLLYIVGCPPEECPPIPVRFGRPEYIIGTSGRRADGSRLERPETPKADREHTPPAMAAWLVELARRCRRHV